LLEQPLRCGAQGLDLVAGSQGQDSKLKVYLEAQLCEFGKALGSLQVESIQERYSQHGSQVWTSR